MHERTKEIFTWRFILFFDANICNLFKDLESNLSRWFQQVTWVDLVTKLLRDFQKYLSLLLRK